MSDRNFVGNPVKLEIKGLLHLQSLFDIVIDQVVVFDTDDSVALAFEKQLDRMISHPARDNTIPDRRAAAALHMAEDGRTGLKSCLLYTSDAADD